MLGTTSKRTAIGTTIAPSMATAGTLPAGRGDSASPSAPVDQPSESRMNRIRRRAHEIYDARGGEHGKAMEDWLQAEREVDAELEVSRTED
jgi:DUF2934 family protein